MKHHAIVLSCVLTCLLIGTRLIDAQTYQNPIISVSLPDPSVIRDNDGSYWLYATEDTRNVPIWHSTDLVHWTFSGTAFTDATRPQMVPRGSIWAPDINKISNKYVLYYSKSVWGGEWDCGIGVAIADQPQGPFTDVGKLFLSQEIGVQNSIDPFFFADKGHNYLFWGSFHGIFGIELSEDGLSIKDGAKKFQIAGGLTEGTALYKHGKYYYLIGSAGTCCQGAQSTYHLVVARSKNVTGPYMNDKGEEAIQNGFTPFLHGSPSVAGPGHCSGIVKDDANKDWLIYHGYLAENDGLGRVTFLDRIIWTKKGWPTIEQAMPSTTTKVPRIKGNNR